MKMHNRYILINIIPSLQKAFLEAGLKLSYLVSAVLYF